MGYYGFGGVPGGVLGGLEVLPPAADRVIEDAEVPGSCLVLARFFLSENTISIHTLPPPHIFCSFVSSSQQFAPSLSVEAVRKRLPVNAGCKYH
jgi:hypothetical protein